MKIVSWTDEDAVRRFGSLKAEDIEILDGDWSGFTATGATIPRSSVALDAPVTPGSIICVGLNYRLHAAEAGLPVPAQPALFTKLVSSLVAADADIVKPELTEMLDYEVELGVVIGEHTRDVSVNDALSKVAGYVCVNDVSARDLQRGDGFGWVRGKSADTFCPVGPYVVSADEVADPQALVLRTFVNGEPRQDSSTADMIFSVAEVISFISQVLTLHPGDLICTGTPSGVGDGMTPPRYLVAGDRVVVEIEGLGSIASTVVDQGSGHA